MTDDSHIGEEGKGWVLPTLPPSGFVQELTFFPVDDRRSDGHSAAAAALEHTLERPLSIPTSVLVFEDLVSTHLMGVWTQGMP